MECEVFVCSWHEDIIKTLIVTISYTMTIEVNVVVAL